MSDDGDPFGKSDLAKFTSRPSDLEFFDLDEAGAPPLADAAAEEAGLRAQLGLGPDDPLPAGWAPSATEPQPPAVPAEESAAMRAALEAWWRARVLDRHDGGS